mgnify:FL=1
MSKTVTQLITDIRTLVDDADAVRWTDTQIKSSMQYAITATANQLHNFGYNELVTSADFSVVNSVAVIPANDGVKNVYVVSGSNLYKLKPGAGYDRNINGVPTGGTIRVDYLPTTVLPALDSDIVTYAGTDINNPVADKYVAYLCAKDLKATEAEFNQLVEAMLPVLERQIAEKYAPKAVVKPWINSVVSNAYYDSKWTVTNHGLAITLYR